MQFIENEICSYTENIWDSILGLKVARSDMPFKFGDGNQTLAGCVHIMGAWEGSVSLLCPKKLAQQAAAIMFGIKEDEANMEQVQDALGELTNMTGGNIKAVLPEPSYLSLPAVAVTDFHMHIPGTELITTVNFTCNNQNFSVTVVRRVK